MIFVSASLRIALARMHLFDNQIFEMNLFWFGALISVWHHDDFCIRQHPHFVRWRPNVRWHWVVVATVCTFASTFITFHNTHTHTQCTPIITRLSQVNIPIIATRTHTHTRQRHTRRNVSSCHREVTHPHTHICAVCVRVRVLSDHAAFSMRTPTHTHHWHTTVAQAMS